MPLITPDELPIWLPGELTIDSAKLGWKDVRIRGYKYDPSDVVLPPMHDYLIVFYRQGATPMNRRCSGPWRYEDVGPGIASLLTQATDSHWHWTVPIEVRHLYVSQSKLAEVASDVHQVHIDHVELRDVLKTDDPVFLNMMNTLSAEIQEGGVGGSLYVEALTNQVCVHMLRNYAGAFRRPPQSIAGLSFIQARRVKEFIADNLENDISLADIARVANISVYYLIRQFHKTFECAPYEYVTRQRLDRAKKMIASGGVPLKTVAAACGFSDQSHMTRLFRRAFDLTPSEFRKVVQD